MISISGGHGRGRATVAMLSVLVLLSPATAMAQRADDLLTTGTRVRVTPMQSERFEGTAERLTMDTLTVAISSGTVVVRYPTSQLERLEVSEGRDRGASALSAGRTGAWIGAIAGAVILGSASGGESLGAVVGFLSGGVEGAAFGAIGGALLAPERWRELSPRTHDR